MESCDCIIRHYYGQKSKYSNKNLRMQKRKFVWEIAIRNDGNFVVWSLRNISSSWHLWYQNSRRALFKIILITNLSKSSTGKKSLYVEQIIWPTSFSFRSVESSTSGQKWSEMKDGLFKWIKWHWRISYQ